MKPDVRDHIVACQTELKCIVPDTFNRSDCGVAQTTALLPSLLLWYSAPRARMGTGIDQAMIIASYHTHIGANLTIGTSRLGEFRRLRVAFQK